MKLVALLAALSLSMMAQAAFDSARAPSGKVLKILRITPSGEDVPAARQIVLEFDRPVVPVGRMARDPGEIPIAISPKLDCQWRWLNTNSLACQLGEKAAMQPATRYRVQVQPKIETEKSERLAEQIEHSFITQRPDIQYIAFHTWQAPGMPVLRVVFNQAVTQASVQAHVYFRPEDKARVPAVVRDDDTTPKYPTLLPLPGEKAALRVGDAVAKQAPKPIARNSWIMLPAKELPLNNSVHLELEPGVQSELGPEPSIQKRTALSFDTFPEFRFLGIRCLSEADDQWTLIPFDEPLPAQTRCHPLRPVAMAFSAPVINDEVKRHVKLEPDLAGGRKDYDPWENRGQRSQLTSPHQKGRDYRVWFPEFLKAYRTYRLISPAHSLADEFGRTLEGAMEMRFRTAHRPPNIKLIHPRAVLEKQTDSEVPIYVTNLDRVDLFYKRMYASGVVNQLRHRIEVPKVADLAFALPLDLRGILRRRSGVVSARLTPTPGSEGSYLPLLFGQVTPFQVHAKLGHYNTLVWVSDLASGEPVPDARVQLYKESLHALSRAPLIESEARTNEYGIASLPGTERLDPRLKLLNQWRDEQPRIFARVIKGDDMALLPLDSEFFVWPRQVPWARERKYGHIRTWGTSAQGVYRAGETIQYKIYVRKELNEALAPAPRKSYTLEIIDPTGKAVDTRAGIELSEFGAFAGEYRVPQEAAVGWYRFTLKTSLNDHKWEPMRVLVSDFTPSAFKIRADLNGEAFEPKQELAITSLATLHAGGPYVDAETRVTVRLKSEYFRSTHAEASQFSFASHTPGQPTEQTLLNVSNQLDDKGQLLTRFQIPDAGIQYGRLLVESAVRDDRGKFVANNVSANYFGRDRFVGLRNTEWVYTEDKPARIALVVVGREGVPVAGVPARVTIEREEIKASRVKGAGNAYLTQYVTTWIGEASCALTSQEAPQACEFVPKHPGSYRITASVHDTQGREHRTPLSAWVTGKGSVVWPLGEDGNLPIVPEKDRLRVGETARFLVRNPFPGARALISIERYGVIRRWVETLAGNTPIIAFTIEPDFIPGFYLSVVVMSPRVAKPLGPDQVDLGRPAFRMGYVEVPVDDPYKQIQVRAKTDKPVYKPREQVTVQLAAHPKHEKNNEPVELAVAVLDEAVFDLIRQGNAYFDPYRGFYDLKGLDVANYSLIKNLVGRQKFEKKGGNPGGDGGADLGLRSLFKFVSYWNPAIRPDRDGRAKISFQAPDNLTGWRVFAMAATPSDRMGLGEQSFKVNKPTELRPVMPNQVIEGDSFAAGFSVMNRTEKPRRLSLKIAASGPIEPSNAEITREIDLQPFKRRTVWLPLTTRSFGEIAFNAAAGDARDKDAMLYKVPVRKYRSLEFAASYGTTQSNSVRESIAIPSAIHQDVGSLSVVASPSVVGNIEGAFRYMRDYPYVCWEQILSRGVMAAHYQGLKGYLTPSFEWKGSEALPKDMLARAASFQAPNGGMSFWIPQDEYASPYLSAYTALAFNWLRKDGYAIPAEVENQLHGYLHSLLREDSLPSFYSKGMASSVRAVALAALVERGKAGLDEMQRYHPHVPWMDLFAKAQYLDAARQVSGTAAIIKDVTDKIMAHADETGGKLQFNESLDDGYVHILATPLRANCTILSALTALGEQDAWAEVVGDTPFKLVRAITQTRGKRDHWENTQENVFCMNALIDYSRIYETAKPSMNVRAFFDTERLGEGRFSDLRDEPMSFERALRAGDAGRKGEVRIERQGQGRLYYATRLSYAPLAETAEAVNAGIEIRREYSVEREGRWVLLKGPMEIRRGELVRVDLFVSLPSARHFVVVDDPVPGGLEPVNRDLATTSEVDADKGKFEAAGGSWWFHYGDWQDYGVSRWSFYHQELRHDAVRFYSEYLGAGNYHLSYSAQTIASGQFAILPVLAQEMYDPDVYGKSLPAQLRVAGE